LATERDRLRAELDPLPPSFADPGLLRARLQDAGQDIAPWRRAGWSMLLGGGACSVLLSLVLHHALWLLLAPVAIAVGIQRLLRAAQLSQRVTACCSELEVATLAEANRRLEEIERSRRALEGTEMALRALAKDESLTERRRGLALEIATTEALLAEIPGAVLQAEEAHRLSAESQALRTSLPALREQERNLTRELAVLEETERDLLDLEDGAEYWRREEAQAREEEQTLLLARELLLDAGRQAHHAFAEPLATRISPLFAAITRGRYPRVRVENDARGFQVQPMTVAGVPVAPEQLSHGAGEQFLLAVRLALGLVVAGPEGTPIFLLDDPLQHFDEERRRHALTVLTEFSVATQMLLATHDPRAIAEFPGATVVKMAG